MKNINYGNYKFLAIQLKTGKGWGTYYIPIPEDAKNWPLLGRCRYGRANNGLGIEYPARLLVLTGKAADKLANPWKYYDLD